MTNGVNAIYSAWGIVSDQLTGGDIQLQGPQQPVLANGNVVLVNSLDSLFSVSVGPLVGTTLGGMNGFGLQTTYKSEPACGFLNLNYYNATYFAVTVDEQQDLTLLLWSPTVVPNNTFSNQNQIQVLNLSSQSGLGSKAQVYGNPSVTVRDNGLLIVVARRINDQALLLINIDLLVPDPPSFTDLTALIQQQLGQTLACGVDPVIAQSPDGLFLHIAVLDQDCTHVYHVYWNFNNSQILTSASTLSLTPATIVKSDRTFITNSELTFPIKTIPIKTIPTITVTLPQFETFAVPTFSSRTSVPLSDSMIAILPWPGGLVELLGFANFPNPNVIANSGNSSLARVVWTSGDSSNATSLAAEFNLQAINCWQGLSAFIDNKVLARSSTTKQRRT